MLGGILPLNIEPFMRIDARCYNTSNETELHMPFYAYFDFISRVEWDKTHTFWKVGSVS